MGKQNTTGELVGTLAWQKWESNAAQSTALETWQTAISRTANPVADGIYKFSWYFELRVVPAGPINSKAVARFSLDSVVKGNSVLVDEEWCGFSGWDYVTNLTAGDEPVLAVEWRRDPTTGGNDSIEIRKVKIALEQMGSQ
jgi:hypothetical protein